MLRAKSDYGPRRDEDKEGEEEVKAVESDFKIRHGFESQLTSEEYNTLLNSVGVLSLDAGLGPVA